MLFQISNAIVADSGTFSCLLSETATNAVSEENVIVGVFRRIEDGELLKQSQSTDYFGSDQSETHFDLKYLKYEVNYSVKYETSFLLNILCAMIIIFGRNINLVIHL